MSLSDNCHASVASRKIRDARVIFASLGTSVSSEIERIRVKIDQHVDEQRHDLVLRSERVKTFLSRSFRAAISGEPRFQAAEWHPQGNLLSPRIPGNANGKLFN